MVPFQLRAVKPDDIKFCCILYSFKMQIIVFHQKGAILTGVGLFAFTEKGVC